MALKRWEVLRVSPPGIGHTKFAICICPRRLWFFYINTKKPPGRRAAEIAVAIASFEAGFLAHESFIDIAVLIPLAEAVVANAAGNPGHCLGPLAPSVVARIIAAVSSSNALEPAHRAAVLDP